MNDGCLKSLAQLVCGEHAANRDFYRFSLSDSRPAFCLGSATGTNSGHHTLNNLLGRVD